MKLHLPKALFTAVIAAFAVSQTVWGEWNPVDTWVLQSTDTAISTDAATPNANNFIFLRAGEGATNLTLESLTLADKDAGYTVTIQNSEDSTYVFDTLTIKVLNLLEADSKLDIGGSSKVQINEITGTLKGLSVGSSASLTLGDGSSAATFALGALQRNKIVSGATITVAKNAVLDLTGITFNDSNTDNNVAMIQLMNAATGTGTIKLASGSAIQTTGTRTAVNISTNYVVEGDANASLVLTAWKDSAFRKWTVLTNGSLTVGAGEGKLNIRAGQELDINGGSVTVGDLYLGHNAAGNGGKLTMGNADSKLTVSSILGLCGKSDSGFNNEVEITAGTLKVTGTNALGVVTADPFESGTSINPILTATIGGSGENSVVLQTSENDWSMDGSALGGGTLTIGNITIDENNSKNISILNANLSGNIKNNAKLTLGKGIIASAAISISGTGSTTIDSTLSGSVSLTGGTIVLNSDFAHYTTKEPGELTYSLTGEDGSFTASTDANGFAKQTSSSYWLIQGDASGSTISSATYGDGKSIAISSDDTGAWFKFDDAVVSHDFYITTGSVDVTSAAQARAERYILNGDTALMNVTEGSVSANDIVINNIGQGITLAETATLTDVSAADDATLLAAVSGTGTIEVASEATQNGYSTAIAPAEGFAGTLYVTSGYFTYETSNIGKTLKLGTGVNFQFNTGSSTLDADQSIILASGNHEMHLNSGSTSFTILGTVSGEGTLVRKGNSAKYVYIQDNASVSNFNNTTGYLVISGNASVTNLSISGGTANISTAGSIEKLYAQTGIVNIGNGTDSAMVKIASLEMGDLNSGDVTGGTLNVKQNATLVVSGEDKLSTTAAKGNYKNTGIILGEWGRATTANVDGALYAKNASITNGDNKGTINISGIVAVKGFRANVESNDLGSMEINLLDGGTLILGETGIDVNTFSGSLGAGTVGISADSVTIAENIALSSTSGTTFDTTKYVWADDGTSIAQGTEGGELTISGTISDHSVTTTEGEGEAATTYPGKLIVTGAGKLTITSSNNTYSGGTSVQGGTLTASAASSLGTGDIEVNKDAVLEIDTSSGGTIQGAVNLKQASTLTVKNGYGSSTINATINVEDSATIESGWGGDYGVLGGTINGSGVLSLACPKWGDGYSTNAWKLTSTISDESADSTLSITSSTNVIISGDNTYSGGTTITERTLTAANESALGTGKVTVDGGTLAQTSALKVSELEYKSGAVSNADNALEADKLTIASGATMSDTGAGTVTVNDTLTISSANAFSLGGALVLTDATIDLSGFTVNTELTESTYVFTLGTAAGGITGVTADGFVYTAPEGYTATLAAISANEAAGVMTLADGDTAVADTLVLTLTAQSDTPETLTKINVTGCDSYDTTNNVLTFTTDADLTGKTFGTALDAVMSDSDWDKILADLKVNGTTLPSEIKVAFQDANGALIDFNGAANSDSVPTITINGVGTNGDPVVSGNGTIVGNYVTAYIPEPTTTTLSLLALAGLAVRRRRR